MSCNELAERGSLMKLMKMKSCAATAPALLVAALAAYAGPTPPAIGERVDAMVAEQVASAAPGCAVGVARGGDVLHARGYGLANLDHEVAITPDTVFDVGSVTKQFTAASIVLLSLDGALGLGDDIRTYLPELPDYGPTITIDHLLHHTSGVRDYLNLMALAGREFYAPISHLDIVELMARQRALNHPPGERYSYSNTGYMLLATIVERVSGRSFGTFARERIFEPMGMTASFLYEDAEHVVPHRATGYAPGAGGRFRMVHNFSFATAGDGQLYTTVGDLLRWSRAFATDRVAGPDFTALMLTPGTLAEGETLGYGGGLFLGEYRGLTTNGHGGSTWGFRARLVRLPDHELAVAVLCNREDANPGRLANGIVDLYLADHLDPAAEPGGPRGRRRGRPGEAAAAPIVIVPGDYEGSYYSEELDARHHIGLDDGALRVRIERWPPLDLISTGGDGFAGIDFPAWTGPRRVSLEFRRSTRGTVTGFSLAAGEARDIEFVRLPDRAQ